MDPVSGTNINAGKHVLTDLTLGLAQDSGWCAACFCSACLCACSCDGRLLCDPDFGLLLVGSIAWAFPCL